MISEDAQLLFDLSESIRELESEEDFNRREMLKLNSMISALMTRREEYRSLMLKAARVKDLCLQTQANILLKHQTNAIAKRYRTNL